MGGRRWVALAATSLLAVVIGACGGGQDRVPAAPGPTAAERRAIHDGLDRIGRVCSRKGRRGTGRVVSREVQGLIAFRRRYPTERFTLEKGGEAGTMFSVLLVARSALLGCSRAGVEAIDRFIPAEVRKALPQAKG